MANDNLIDINLNVKSQDLKLSSLVDSVKYIQLKGEGESVVGRIRKIFYVKDFVVILNASGNGNVIHVFNEYGDMLYRIDKEKVLLPSIDDMALDKASSLLYIYSEQSLLIKVVSLVTGTTKKNVPSRKNFRNFRISNNKLVFFRDGVNSYDDEFKNYRILDVDFNGENEFRWIDYPLNSIVSAGGSIFFNTNLDADQSIVLGRFANDTIFSYKGSEIYPVYKLNPSNNAYKEFKNIKSLADFELIVKDSSRSFLLGPIFENDRHLYCNYRVKNIIHFCIYDKVTKSCNLIRSIINDVNGVFIPFPDYIDNKSWVGVIPRHGIAQQLRYVAEKKLHLPNIQQLENLNNNDNKYSLNPIIYIANLKN